MELPEINVSMVTQLWVGWDWKGWKCHYRRELNELFRHFVQFLYYENVKKWSLKAVKCGWLSSALVTKKRKSWSCSKKRWRCFIVACFKGDSGETECLQLMHAVLQRYSKHKFLTHSLIGRGTNTRGTCDSRVKNWSTNIRSSCLNI